MSIIVCPSCKALLLTNNLGQFQCPSGHSFDLAKEGYLNLLLANKKKSIAPGDNKLMIEARRAFLKEGYYDPLVLQINDAIRSLNIISSNLKILDIACGEGYYTEHVLNSIFGKSSEIIGLDISKYAIRRAAKKYTDPLFVVGSAFDLPILDHTLDLILSIFGPVDAASFSKVLDKNGFLVCVTAGENHLKELALLIYDQFRPHKQSLISKLDSHFELLSNESLIFELDLNLTLHIIDLLKMTPYYYNCSEERMENILKITSLKLTCDFNISIFKPK